MFWQANDYQDNELIRIDDFLLSKCESKSRFLLLRLPLEDGEATLPRLRPRRWVAHVLCHDRVCVRVLGPDRDAFHCDALRTRAANDALAQHAACYAAAPAPHACAAPPVAPLPHAPPPRASPTPCAARTSAPGHIRDIMADLFMPT